LVATFEAMLQVYGVKPFGVVDAETLNTALVDNPDLIVIDVRTDDELAENGVIDTGEIELIHIPLEQIVAQMDLWPADKDAAIVIYCGSGHRSTMALTILGAYGYSNLSSLKGGFGGWAEAGYPVAEFATP
jgi:hydroxyacylglutathione hydrolase